MIPTRASLRERFDRKAHGGTEPSPPGNVGTKPPSLLGRLFGTRNVLSLLLAVAVLYLVFRQGMGLDWREVWTNVRGTNAGLLALGFAVFYASFPVRAGRWGILLGNVGAAKAERPMPGLRGLTRIMYLSWFANCVTVARLGDVYRGYLLGRATGVPIAVTVGTVVAERLLDLAVLSAMLSGASLVVLHGSLPPEASFALAAALVLSLAGAACVLLMRRLSGPIKRLLPVRLRGHYASFERGTVGSFRRVPALGAYSVAGWVLEGAALYFVALAVGAPVSAAGSLVVALVASLLTTVPITPAGLGFAEVGTLAMLQWLGLDASTAGAVTLISRLITYWSIVSLGSLVYLYNSRRPVEVRPLDPKRKD